MMLLFVLFVLVSAEKEALKLALRSRSATRQLYLQHKRAENLDFDAAEDKERFKLFRRSLEFVVAANDDSDSTTFGLNKFSTLTDTEMAKYTQFNRSEPNSLPTPRLLKRAVIPSKVDWVAAGAVTEMKDMLRCDCTWAFAAVGGLETRYYQISGHLTSFSEQELLSCTYFNGKDGCKGGSVKDAYGYSKYHGRLATETDYPYAMRSATCTHHKDGMVVAKITDTVTVPDGEDSLVTAISTGSVVVGLEFTQYMQHYVKGMLRDKICNGNTNFAATAVGYTPRFIRVKTSLGKTWGEKGYVRFPREHHNCGLYNHAVYPVLKARKDTCIDIVKNCAEVSGECEKSSYIRSRCCKTCCDASQTCEFE